MVSRIPEKFRGNHEAEVLKQVRGHLDKSWYFAPFSVASAANSPKILKDHSYPIPHHSTKFCPNRPLFQCVSDKFLPGSLH